MAKNIVKKTKNPDQMVCFKIRKKGKETNGWLYYRLPRIVITDVEENDESNEFEIVFINKGTYKSHMNKLIKNKNYKNNAL